MNMNIKVIDIGNYTPEIVFERLYRPGTSCLLESASFHPITGRYSIIAAEPDFACKAGSIEEIYELIKSHKIQYNAALPPFTGGAVGFISYDAVRDWEDIRGKAEENISIPKYCFLFYSKLIVFDHLLGKIFLINENLPEKINKSGYQHTAGGHTARFRPGLSKEAFTDIVLRAKDCITEGDIYQANLSQRLEAETESTGWDLYKRLRIINPSPFAGYIDFDGIELISCSPERLIKSDGCILQTRPIAGTYPRGKSEEEDRDLAYKLLLHPKERAEHIMLVDLERNDIGRICSYGSVNVSELMTIESYSHVHHIVSNVIGRMKENINIKDIVKAVFPGGTITGCPKIRCMQIIDELEPVRRNIYTGSMGYIGYNGSMDLNIIIRTILKLGKKLYLQAGAGIVADSDPEREYKETLYKASALMQAVSRCEAQEKLID